MSSGMPIVQIRGILSRLAGFWRVGWKLAGSCGVNKPPRRSAAGLLSRRAG